MYTTAPGLSKPFSLFGYILLLISWCALPQFTQAQSVTAVDHLNEPMPAFDLYLLRTNDMINTDDIPPGIPTVFIVFSPDCGHCAELAENLRDSVYAFHLSNLFLVSPPMPEDSIRAFGRKHQLFSEPVIRVAQDPAFALGSFYQISTVPYVFIYDEQKRLSVVLDKPEHVKDIIAALETVEKKSSPEDDNTDSVH